MTSRASKPRPPGICCFILIFHSSRMLCFYDWNEYWTEQSTLIQTFSRRTHLIYYTHALIGAEQKWRREHCTRWVSQYFCCMLSVKVAHACNTCSVWISHRASFKETLSTFHVQCTRAFHEPNNIISHMSFTCHLF